MEYFDNFSQNCEIFEKLNYQQDWRVLGQPFSFEFDFVQKNFLSIELTDKYFSICLRLNLKLTCFYNLKETKQLTDIKTKKKDPFFQCLEIKEP